MRFSEETLITWTKPPSNTENEKLKNAERIVKDALQLDDFLCSKRIKTFCQGSYANDTNIRLDSDIDVNVHYTDAFYYDLPQGMAATDFGIENYCDYSYKKYKNDIEKALLARFGRQSVKRKNKCFTVIENTYRAKVDVVPTWPHRLYSKNNTYTEGVVLFADDDSKVVNYPLQHIENGKKKNENTQRRYKRMVRIFKRLKIKMEDDGFFKDNCISSFLLESLIWNCPNDIFNEYSSWNERVRAAIIFIYNNTQGDSASCKDWREVSDLLYLFHSDGKWTKEAVNIYMKKLWMYMGY